MRNPKTIQLLVISGVALFLPGGMRAASTACDAGSAAWLSAPASGVWSDCANWDPATVPNDYFNGATFDSSSVVDISIPDLTNLGSATFNPGASPFTISSFYLTFYNVGIVNNSGIVQSFVASPVMQFLGSANAGNLTRLTVAASDSGGGIILFQDFSSAANAVVVSAAGGAGIFGGNMFFYGSSTAGNATLIADSGSEGGTGGLIRFVQDSSGGTARAQLLGNGLLQIDMHNAPGITIGSLEGGGHVMLGTNTLTVGSNDLSTTFSGVIEGDGSLTKIGAGVLTLSGSNRYTGHTTVTEGTLLVDSSGPGTGKGIVRVQGGTLGGSGNIAGLVTIGTGSGSGAFLSPGDNGPGTLSIRRQLTFGPNATFNCELSAATGTADQVIAKGVRISPGALFSFSEVDSGTLTPGTVFKVIDNRSGSQIHLTFSNLADGSTFTAGSNTFAVSYEGGNGNDLTLTVVP